LLFGGWAGKILRVDLSRKRIREAPVEGEIDFIKYLGGRGFTSRILFDEVTREIDPYDPDNRLIFAAGPLTGTIVPASCRWTVAAKSPLTGILGDGNAGGFFGSSLKWAGYDMIIIHGKSRKPVYLFIEDGKAEIKDAEELWGEDTWTTDSRIKEDVGDPEVKVACIGPAGENLVRYAKVRSDERSAGRCGIGAVMGSKKLKAVAVRGTGLVPISNPQRLRKVVEEVERTMLSIKQLSNFTASGTLATVHEEQKRGILTTRNFLQGRFEGMRSMSGGVFHRDYFVKRRSCFGCPISCDRLFVVADGPFKGSFAAGLEAGTLMSLGSACGNANAASLVRAHELADKLGICVISLGLTISFAMECYQNRLITKEDTDGIDLSWGNYDAILDLTFKIARREGFGDLLAEGSMRAARRIGKGAEDYAMTVKGMEVCPLDPRGAQGWGLAYAVAARGGDHMRGEPGVEFDPTSLPERTVKKLFGTTKVLDRFTAKWKGLAVKWYEDMYAIEDSLGICRFAFEGEMRTSNLILSMFEAATGLKIGKGQFEMVGERINNLERLYNAREGISRKDDRLPKRFTEESLTSGASKRHTVDLEPMLDEYYDSRKWDRRTGLPSKLKLEELDLSQTS